MRLISWLYFQLKNSRFYILVVTGLICWLVMYLQSSGLLEQYALTYIQVLAFLSVFYLYTAVIIGPLTIVYPLLPYKAQLIKARRAIGVSAFIFGALHGFLAFNVQMGGFAYLNMIPPLGWVGIALGATSTLILLALTLTSTDWAVKKMGFKNWKRLHRLVHLACLLILMHAGLFGLRFYPGQSIMPYIWLVLLVVLIGLHVKAFLKIKSLKQVQ